MNLTSIISNIIALPLIYFVILWFVMYLIILFAPSKHTISHKEYKELKESKELFKLHLDQYYIKNKMITFTCCFIYFFGISFIFILLRYAYVGQINYFTHIHYTPDVVILTYLKIIIIIMLYKKLLDALFKKEINKFYLYFRSFSWYYTLKDLLRFNIGEYLIGCIRVPVYRIATLTFKEDMYPFEDINMNYIHDDEYNYAPTNKYIISFVYKMQNLAQKYPLVQRFFIIFAYILRFIHIHIHGIFQQAPYIILFLTFLIELYLREFKYIYIISFLVILVKTKHNLLFFVDKRGIVDRQISEYFYKNQVDYSVQRLSFFKNNNITIQTPLFTKANKNLYFYHKDIVEYIQNNFEYTLYDQKDHRRKVGRYRRVLLILSFVIIACYILLYKVDSYSINISTLFLILFTLIPIMIYYSYQTNYVISYQEFYSVSDWRYSLKHNIVFWIVAGLQAYIFWLLLFKPELIIPDSEIILDNIIKIRRIYTIEGKIMYLYQYFDYYIQSTSLTIEEQDLLRDKLRQIDFKEIIDETTTLKDIIENMRYFIAAEYYKNAIFITERITELYMQENPWWYNLIRNISFITVISTGIMNTVFYYEEFLTVVRRLNDPYQIYLMGLEIRSNYPKLAQMPFDFISKVVKDPFPSLFDHLFYYGINIPLQVGIILSAIIFALFGTFLLPGFINSFNTRPLIENKVCVTFLDNMSTIPIIAPYNQYYLVGLFLVIILIIIGFKIRASKAKAKTNINNYENKAINKLHT